MEHLRYPEDLFKLQRALLRRTTSPTRDLFYGGQDRWIVPTDPTVDRQAADQPPYYQTIQMPDTGEPRLLADDDVRAPEPAEPGRRSWRSTPTRAATTTGPSAILRLPGNTQIDGPGQVANDFETNPEVARELSLLRQGDARTVEGNLLTLPVGGGLLYVQPIYVQRASGDAAYPLLQRVLVSFGSRIGYAATLQEALDQIFQGDSGTETGEEPGTETPPTEGETPPTEETPPPVEEPAGDLEAAIADAQQAYDDAQAAQQSGDWAAYGLALDRLEEALARAETLSGGGAPPQPSAEETPGG